MIVDRRHWNDNFFHLASIGERSQLDYGMQWYHYVRHIPCVISGERQTGQSGQFVKFFLYKENKVEQMKPISRKIEVSRFINTSWR